MAVGATASIVGVGLGTSGVIVGSTDRAGMSEGETEALGSSAGVIEGAVSFAGATDGETETGVDSANGGGVKRWPDWRD